MSKVQLNMDRIADPENQRLEYQDESGPTTLK